MPQCPTSTGASSSMGIDLLAGSERQWLTGAPAGVMQDRSKGGYKHMAPALIERVVQMRVVLGMSVSAIAREVGYSVEGVRKRLRQNRVDTARQHKLTKQQRLQALARYRGGKTCEEIAGPLGVTRGAVEYWLKRMGQERRKPAHWLRKYRLNEQAFDVLTPEALYWLGFIYADGCVVHTARKRCVRVEVQWQDREHLDRLLAFVGSSMRPYHSERRGKRYATMVLNSRHMVSTLAGHGIHPRKTSNSCRLQDAFATSHDFWRGMVDGDGCVMYHPDRDAYKMYLLANREEIHQFREYVLPRAPSFAGKPSLQDGIYRLALSGFSAAAVLKDLYGGEGPALPRKAEAARAIVDHFSDKDPNDRSRIAWPPVEELASEVAQTSVSAAGRRLGVTHVAVRQRLRKFDARPAAQPRSAR